MRLQLGSIRRDESIEGALVAGLRGREERRFIQARHEPIIRDGSTRKRPRPDRRSNRSRS
jgi:hypothetical protein